MQIRKRQLTVLMLIAMVLLGAFVLYSRSKLSKGQVASANSAVRVQAQVPEADKPSNSRDSSPLSPMRSEFKAGPNQEARAEILAALSRNDRVSIDRAVQLGLYELTSDELWSVIESYLATSESNKAFGELPCHLAACGAHGLVVEDSPVGSAHLTASKRSRDDLAYVASFCGPLNQKLTYSDFRKIQGQLSKAQVCTLEEAEMLDPESLDSAPSSKLVELIQHSRSPSLREAAAFTALSREIAIEGIDWDDFSGELVEMELLRFARLLATKFICDQRGACAPMSPFLYMLCDNDASLDCKVTSDLTQIARDSLSPRAYSWWDSARLPQKPAK